APGGATLPGAAIALYSANQVALATFFGTLLGGGVLLAINERRLGRAPAALWSIVLGALGSLALLGIAFVLPDNFPSPPLGIGSIVAMRAVAQQRQQALVQAHVVAGGKRGSSWVAVGVGLASLAAILVPLFVGLLVLALVGKEP